MKNNECFTHFLLKLLVLSFILFFQAKACYGIFFVLNLHGIM